MKYFDKDVIENLVLEELKKYDEKYKYLERSDKPDLQSENPSIGVEITIAESQDFLDSFEYKDKTLIEYVKMKDIKSYKKKEFDDINKMIGNILSDNIIDSRIKNDMIKFINLICYKKKNQILPVSSLSEYYNLDPNVNLYWKDEFKRIPFFDGEYIKTPLSTVLWNGSVINKIIDSVLMKNKKFKKYKKFKENILALVNFTCDYDDLIYLKEKLLELEDIEFSKIIIIPGRKNQNIFEINLKS